MSYIAPSANELIVHQDGNSDPLARWVNSRNESAAIVEDDEDPATPSILPPSTRHPYDVAELMKQRQFESEYPDYDLIDGVSEGEEDNNEQLPMWQDPEALGQDEYGGGVGLTARSTISIVSEGNGSNTARAMNIAMRHAPRGLMASESDRYVLAPTDHAAGVKRFETKPFQLGNGLVKSQWNQASSRNPRGRRHEDEGNEDRDGDELTGPPLSIAGRYELLPEELSLLGLLPHADDNSTNGFGHASQSGRALPRVDDDDEFTRTEDGEMMPASMSVGVEDVRKSLNGVASARLKVLEASQAAEEERIWRSIAKEKEMERTKRKRERTRAKMMYFHDDGEAREGRRRDEGEIMSYDVGNQTEEGRETGRRTTTNEGVNATSNGNASNGSSNINEGNIDLTLADRLSTSQGAFSADAAVKALDEAVRTAATDVLGNKVWTYIRRQQRAGRLPVHGLRRPMSAGAVGINIAGDRRNGGDVVGTETSGANGVDQGAKGMKEEPTTSIAIAAANAQSKDAYRAALLRLSTGLQSARLGYEETASLMGRRGEALVNRLMRKQSEQRGRRSNHEGEADSGDDDKESERSMQHSRFNDCEECVFIPNLHIKKTIEPVDSWALKERIDNRITEWTKQKGRKRVEEIKKEEAAKRKVEAEERRKAGKQVTKKTREVDIETWKKERAPIIKMKRLPGKPAEIEVTKAPWEERWELMVKAKRQEALEERKRREEAAKAEAKGIVSRLDISNMKDKHAEEIKEVFNRFEKYEAQRKVKLKKLEAERDALLFTFRPVLEGKGKGIEVRNSSREKKRVGEGDGASGAGSEASNWVARLSRPPESRLKASTLQRKRIESASRRTQKGGHHVHYSRGEGPSAEGSGDHDDHSDDDQNTVIGVNDSERTWPTEGNRRYVVNPHPSRDVGDEVEGEPIEPLFEKRSVSPSYSESFLPFASHLAKSHPDDPSRGMMHGNPLNNAGGKDAPGSRVSSATSPLQRHDLQPPATSAPRLHAGSNIRSQLIPSNTPSSVHHARGYSVASTGSMKGVTSLNITNASVQGGPHSLGGDLDTARYIEAEMQQEIYGDLTSSAPLMSTPHPNTHNNVVSPSLVLPRGSASTLLTPTTANASNSISSGDNDGSPFTSIYSSPSPPPFKHSRDFSSANSSPGSRSSSPSPSRPPSRGSQLPLVRSYSPSKVSHQGGDRQSRRSSLSHATAFSTASTSSSITSATPSYLSPTASHTASRSRRQTPNGPLSQWNGAAGGGGFSGNIPQTSYTYIPYQGSADDDGDVEYHRE